MKFSEIILFDDPQIRGNLLPLTLSRPIAEIRIGILTISEKWKLAGAKKISFLTENYLSEKFSLEKSKTNLLINASVLPDEELLEEISQLQNDEQLVKDEILIAAVSVETDLEKIKKIKKKTYKRNFLQIRNLWDIFSLNEKALKLDFAKLTKGKRSQKIHSSNQFSGEENIFIEEGGTVKFSVINAETGPVYIGKNAEVMEGSLIRGPFALCESATLKMGGKIYGATTIGPHCKVGGEINNSVFFGFSNKAHDGFLGNSVIGEWCNIGADSNNSNLKNNYDFVKLWHYPSQTFIDTGLQFCGLFMGDHTKCGINTMFNTGTVAGFSSNIFGAGFPRTFIPSFSWGGAHGFTPYRLEKAMETAQRMMQRRNIPFTEADKKIWEHISRNP